MLQLPKSSRSSTYHSKPLLPTRHPQRVQSPRQTFRQVLLVLTLVFVGSLLLPGSSDQHDKKQADLSALEQQANAQAHANEVLANVGNPLPAPKASSGKSDANARASAASADVDDASLPPSPKAPTHGHATGKTSDRDAGSHGTSLDHLLVEDGVALSAARVSTSKDTRLSSSNDVNGMDRPPSSSSDLVDTQSSSGSRSKSAPVQKQAPSQRPANGGDPRWAQYAVIVKSGKDVVQDRFPPLLATSLRGVKNLILVGDADIENVGDTGVDMVDVVTSVVNPVRLVTEKSDEDENDEIEGDGADSGGKRPNAEDSQEPKKKQSNLKQSQEVAKTKPTRIEDTRGWKFDAYKFLPSVREAYRQFPKADWFLIADDDTYFFMESVHAALSHYEPSDRHYFGSGNVFVGCDGVTEFGQGPMFAHGGGGIILSRGAVQALLPNLNTCIPKYFECWAGDVSLALCLRDSGIRHSDIGYGFRFYQDNPGSDKWAFPIHIGAACDRPLSMHHLRAGDLDKLKNAEQSAGYKAKYVSKMESKVSPKTHPWLYASSATTEKNGGGAKLAAAVSPFYSPVNLGDIWRAFMVGDRVVRGQRRAVGVGSPSDANGLSDKSTQATSPLISSSQLASAEKCMNACESHGKKSGKSAKSETRGASCLTWDYDTESQRCRLFDSLVKMEPAAGWVTGAREGAEKKVGKDRLFACEKREL
ncbi:hypothetical protein BCR44DRAFT_1430231 [Catenaria anguillulae PL171]|uniref:N-acetylgalactosaminide beta-1,3-galactosyltransferase n=1 Tax=Catenaria anguillulae PL171 TaxID=765915 RepID=A0A1Y2HS62_9FUNG|nr:hypothetical protein BCR44DRAFT_1430231 [Catenaria anguillulae PL171]